jgi:hypothetical protein
MDDVNLFLAHAIQLERDAARRFEDLSHSMQTAGNVEVEQLFCRLGEFSRLHLQEAMARGGFRDLPQIPPEAFEWPDGLTPEAASWSGVDAGLDTLAALELALAGEQSGLAYYESIAERTGDAEVANIAREFAREEAQHVQELKHWIKLFLEPEAGANASP